MPITLITKCCEQNGETDDINRTFDVGQDRKLVELHFVQVAVRNTLVFLQVHTHPRAS
ncbi:hypothetical protein F4680DRAFT_435612 [Xylaria scruposa]|nr:hypothetical protein F4680DRAFT_435612 [Xylaria scruposa]